MLGGLGYQANHKHYDYCIRHGHMEAPAKEGKTVARRSRPDWVGCCGFSATRGVGICSTFTVARFAGPSMYSLPSPAGQRHCSAWRAGTISALRASRQLFLQRLHWRLDADLDPRGTVIFVA
jgi:hypothetical protein